MPSPPSPSSIPQLKILRAYAKLKDASLSTGGTLPPTVYFSHTRHTLTIFDAYPKALFHFLVLPRLSLGLRTAAAAATSSRLGTPALEDDHGDGDSEVVVVADRTEDLTSLRTLLLLQRAADPDARARARARAIGTLSVLSDEATRLQSQIEREMQTHYGFKWPIWIGFHAIPSME